MLKRLAVLLFILTVSGQATLGVCRCFGTEVQPRHSCCKRSKSKASSISQPGCCGSETCSFTNERVPQNNAEKSAIKFFPKVQPAPADRAAWQPGSRIFGRTISPLLPIVDHRLKYARPPDLYLRHNSFLI